MRTVGPVRVGLSFHAQGRCSLDWGLPFALSTASASAGPCPEMAVSGQYSERNI